MRYSTSLIPRFILACLLGTFLAPQISAAAEVQPEILWHYLTTGMATTAISGWREVLNDRSVTDQTLSIAGKKYLKGMGTHATSTIVIPLNKKYHKFHAEVGVDDGGGEGGSVVFKVALDDKEAFNSGLTKFGEAAKPVDLDVTGVAVLTLLVTDGGDGPRNDHADWANVSVDEPAKRVPDFSTAGFFAVPGSPRMVANFNPGWRFLKADATRAEKPDYDDSSWEAANLPHGMEILDAESGCRNYQGPAWYRKRFATPTLTPEGRLVVYFEAVMGKCVVWVNGQKVAEHFGGYLPFAADITEQLNKTGENIIAVRADNSNDPTYPPGKPQSDLDFTYMGGIYRDVFLIQSDAVRATLPELSSTIAGGGVFVAVKDVNGQDASLEVRTEVANGSASPHQVLVRTILETADKHEVVRDEKPLQIPAGGAVQITQNLEAKGVHLWHPDDPYLHFIHTEIVENGTVRDSLRTRFGIRLFEMRAKDGLYINKQPFHEIFNGVNRHQDHALIGNALPKSMNWRDVKLLRDGGVNFIRAAHYPQAPAFYDACDELGMLVTSANPGWQFWNDKDPIFEQRVYSDTRALVRRDRNRPSLLLWETVLNETDDQPARLLTEMHRIVHEEDPFPGVFNVADAPLGRKGGFDVFYFGTENGTKNTLVREYGDGSETDFYSNTSPVRINREWGEAAMLHQATIRAHYLGDIFGAYPCYLGAALWAGIDHQRGYSPEAFWGGLLDAYRVPRPAYYLFKSQYPPDYNVPGVETGPMVYITNEVTQISAPDVIVYSNCEEVRLTWLGKVIDTRKPDTDCKHLPHPPFTFTNVFSFDAMRKQYGWNLEKAQMVAEGLIGGKVVVTEVKKFAQQTTGVKLSLADAGIGLTADGSDVIPVRATIVDNKGVPKVLASEYVIFEVTGPGELVNGPMAHANPAKAVFGTVTALIRSTNKPGIIHVRASILGLKGDEIDIQTLPPALPMFYDQAYATASRPPLSDNVIISSTSANNLPIDVRQLQEQNAQLQQELTTRTQQLIDLRHQLNQ